MKCSVATLSILTLGLLFLSSPNALESCTAFYLQHNDQVCTGKNLDWPIGDGMIVINRKGTGKIALADPPNTPVRWTSIYNSITFNQFGTDFPLGGMNERGLVVEELSYSPSVYPSPDSFATVNEMQWVQYQLDTCASVREVIDTLSRIRMAKWLFGLHYLVSDKSGNAAVIEYIDGEVLCYTGDTLPVQVLSNNRYENTLAYLYRHRGYGGDMLPVNDTGSQSRFVRAAMMLDRYDDAHPSSPTAYALSILDSVQQSDTQWSIVYDPVRLEILYRLYQKPAVYTLRWTDIDWNGKTRSHCMDLTTPCSPDPVAHCFQPCTAERNNTLLQTVLEALVRLQELDSRTAVQLFDRLKAYYKP
jgi:choloylglycine hydrolase